MLNMEAIGIYQIRNLVNGKLYIGSTSVSFRNRWRQHLGALKLGKHYCKHLQYSWNKYGEESFVFEIIEEIQDVELVIPREQFWLDTYAGTAVLYNTAPTAGSTRGVRFSPESKAKISKAIRAFYQTPKGRAQAHENGKRLYATEEGRAKHLAGQRRRWANPEHRARSSAVQKIVAQDPEVKRRRSISQKRRLEDPTAREAFNERNRRIARDPLVRAKLAISKRIAFAKPEVKARMSAGQQRRFSTDEGKVQASNARRPRDAAGNPIKFHLRGPDGTIYRDISNLAAFCREHGIRVANVGAVLRGEVLRTRDGWTRYVEDSDAQNENTGASPIGRFNLVDPDGAVYWDIPNVAAFCRKYGLNHQAIHALLKGRMQRTRDGWTRYDGPPPDDDAGED